MSKRYFRIGTGCPGFITGEHDHSLPTDKVAIEPGVWATYSRRPVKVKAAPDGRLYRVFGLINYDTATGETLITEYAGATDEEQRSLVATALATDPSDWTPHPCEPGRTRISVCGYVDSSYLDAAAEALFHDLTADEETSALAAWSGGLQLA